jgi:hypothetical protein
MTPSPHFHFEYDAANGVLAVRMKGAITDHVFKDCYSATLRLVEGRNIRAALMDLSAVDRYDVSAAAMLDISTLPPLFPDPTPRYVVAPPDHIFGMARMLQLASVHGRDMLHVVRSLQEAYDGLGVTTPQFERLAELP